MKNCWKDIYCWSGITVWQNRCFTCFVIRFEWLLYINIFTNFKAVLMIYEINHIWTAEMKWKWTNDRRSERNLCNLVKRPEKNSGLQRGLNPWPRDYRCDALLTELWSHWRWQLARPFIHSFNFVRRHKFTFVRTWKLCDDGNPPLV